MDLVVCVPPSVTLDDVADTLSYAIWRTLSWSAAGAGGHGPAGFRRLTDILRLELGRRCVFADWPGDETRRYHLDVGRDPERFWVELAGEVVCALEGAGRHLPVLNLITRDVPEAIRSTLALFRGPAAAAPLTAGTGWGGPASAGVAPSGSPDGPTRSV